jgi:regulator of RNase E activity RraB
MTIDKEQTIEALKRLKADGSDLTKPMEIDFFVAVPSSEAGRKVADKAGAFGFTVSVEQDSETKEWTCYCNIVMVPEYGDVIKYEELLNAIGEESGGYADGFGSYGNANDKEGL